MAALGCFLERDQAGFDAVVGSDADASVLLPVVMSELVSALQTLTSPGRLRREVSRWLEEHRARFAA